MIELNKTDSESWPAFIKHHWGPFKASNEAPIGLNEGDFSDDRHPERTIILDHVNDIISDCNTYKLYYKIGEKNFYPIVEIGCGHRKTDQSFIGIDKLAPGSTGAVGCVAGQTIACDFQADATELPLPDSSVKAVVGRHIIEHIPDVNKTLTEWKRVLMPFGRIVLVVPDESAIRTLPLDPTHVAAYTPADMYELFRKHNFIVTDLSICIVRWSFLIVGIKN